MKPEKIVEKYFEELEHFFIPGIGGWPLTLEGKRHEKLLKIMPCFYVNKKNRLALKKNVKPDPNIMVELYKRMYEEMVKHCLELSDTIDKMSGNLK